MYRIFPYLIIVCYSILFILCYNVLAEPRLETRVFGGEKARNRSNFAYVASIALHQHHICGGALVRLDAVLSSATCCTRDLGDDVHELSIKVGTLDIHDATNFTEVSEVKEIFIHPKYNRIKNKNDLVILLTRLQFTENLHVKPITLPRKKHTNYTNCVVSGWGKPNSKFQLYTKDLHYGIVDVIDDTECLNKVKPYNIESEYLICTNGSSRPSQFDDGSPLSCSRKLVGIVIYTEDYANKNSPGVYIDIYPYLGWINDDSTKLMACFSIIIFSAFVAGLL